MSEDQLREFLKSELVSKIHARKIPAARGIRGLLPLKKITYTIDFDDVVSWFKKLFKRKK